MEPAHGAARPARIRLLAASAAVALDLGPGAAPLLSALVATVGAPAILDCPCFDLRDRLGLSSEIHDLQLGVLDLGRVQAVEGIEKPAKVVVQHGYPPRQKPSNIGPSAKSRSSPTRLADTPKFFTSRSGCRSDFRAVHLLVPSSRPKRSFLGKVLIEWRTAASSNQTAFLSGY